MLVNANGIRECGLTAKRGIGKVRNPFLGGWYQRFVSTTQPFSRFLTIVKRMMQKRKRFQWTVLGLACLSIASGCQSVGPNQYRGGLIGGGAGSLIGAAIGSTDGKALEGAAIGGALGSTIGSLEGRQRDQENAAYQRANQQRAIHIDQVIQMTRSGLSDEVIVNQIRATGIVAPPTHEQLIHLKNSGVSDRVIAAMQGAGFAPAVGPVPAPAVVEHVWVEPRFGPPPFRRRHCRPYPRHRRSVGFSFGF